MIERGEFFAHSWACQIHRQKGYFSKDRESEIVFDVSIEIRMPGEDEYALLYLIECKNYGRRVPVADLEAFYAKVKQVGSANAKAVLAARSAFQSGSVNFARSKGIGLLRQVGLDQIKWIHQRSPSIWTPHTNYTAPDAGLIALALETEVIQSPCFDWYAVAPEEASNSLNQFLTSLGAHDATQEVAELLTNVVRPPSPSRTGVPYLEKHIIEDAASTVHRSIGYLGGEVHLKAVCDWQSEATGLRVQLSPNAAPVWRGHPILGSYSRDPLEIVVYDVGNPVRERFTLAHELGHHMLGHSEYLVREAVDLADLKDPQPNQNGTKQVRRMEWQANYFASCLLMPRDEVSRAFWFEAEFLGLRDRGFGPLYVDEQRTNIRAFVSLTNSLKRKFEVSRQAIKIRLETLGLLNDSRRGPLQIQSFLGL